MNVIKARKMLIVDDDLAAQKALGLIFTQKGFEIRTAANGEEGLRAIAADRPDIILLDIAMPTMNGVKMLKILRSQPEGKGIPVVIVTNSDVENLLRESTISEDPAIIMVKTNWSLENIASEVLSIVDSANK